MPVKHINYGTSKPVSSFIAEQYKSPISAAGIQNSVSASSTMPLKNERLGRKVVELFIPEFLRAKSLIDNSKGE
jgi:hypothetical protein